MTSICNNKDCVFTCYDEKGCCYIVPSEKAYQGWQDGLLQTGIMPSLPIRIGDYGPYKAVNYHRLDVCKAAVLHGEKRKCGCLPILERTSDP